MWRRSRWPRRSVCCLKAILSKAASPSAFAPFRIPSLWPRLWTAASSRICCWAATNWPSPSTTRDVWRRWGTSALDIRVGSVQDPRQLWTDTAAYGRWKGQSFLCVENFAPLFYQALLDQGLEFTADPARDNLNQNYVNLYNSITEAAFTHGLSSDCRLDLPCRVESSTSLIRRSWDSYYLTPISEGDLLAEGYGLIVTAREPRSLRNLPRFLGWLCEGKRLGRLALDAGLLPAVSDPLSTDTPLQALLLSLRNRTLHLPDWNSGYAKNREAFETSFRANLELLH